MIMRVERHRLAAAGRAGDQRDAACAPDRRRPGCPAVSLPSASVSVEARCAERLALDDLAQQHLLALGFATSMPTTALPGTGARMRTPRRAQRHRQIVAAG